MLISSSGQLGNAVVLTGLFSDSRPANGDRPGLRRRTYQDDAVIEYDSIVHHLRAVLPDSATTELTSKSGIQITGPITHLGD